jgi:2-polyprenyl-3-methyl-5-hydroxy-6-metoxy-1,4-benzoquinol methylase
VIRDLLTVLRHRQERTPQPLVWTPELVERFWDGVWTTRLKEFSFAKQAGRALIVAIDHLLPAGTRVLDFGAGFGDLAGLLLERGVRVAGHDPSPAARAALATRFGAHPGFAGTLGPDDRQQFDLVVMAEVIEHVLDDEFEATLARVARFTAPGGLVVVTTPNNEDLELGMCVDPLANVVFHRWQHVRSFTRETLAERMARVGFEEVVIHELELSAQLFVPFDRVWGDGSPLPSHLVEIRGDRPCLVGGQQNLVYIGRRPA